MWNAQGWSIANARQQIQLIGFVVKGMLCVSQVPSPLVLIRTAAATPVITAIALVVTFGVIVAAPVVAVTVVAIAGVETAAQ
ncbi:MAG: hypothetical protein M0P72_01525 [Metallibacterium scheffleri]|jgi:hypothetical protein|uniref:hypothetical protein n=1 Tax=Metallibacterium scheffleri TaxID=993689 RepID=UPI0026EE0E63|nr:hypothetical protein [Metallibacterium scheffleri]MCK9365817.1 hypothetical protein [Metallibacterium scheffleri]